MLDVTHLSSRDKHIKNERLRNQAKQNRNQALTVLVKTDFTKLQTKLV